VLARHLRRCQQGQREHEAVLGRSPKQSRAKSACNRCAKLKLRCDSQNPCRLCNLSSNSCKYTRQGYSDPYKHFQISGTGNIGGSNNVTLPSPRGEDPLPRCDDPALTLANMDLTNSTIVSQHILNNNLTPISMQELQKDGTSSTHSSGDFGLSSVSTLENENADFDFSLWYDFQFNAGTPFAFPEIMAYTDLGYQIAPQPVSGVKNGGKIDFVLSIVCDCLYYCFRSSTHSPSTCCRFPPSERLLTAPN
jgi:hypothetical protein